MIAYEQVEQYMKEVGLKYIKTPNDFITGLAIKTDKQYAQDMAYELNSRGEGAPVDNSHFYELKNRSLDGSIYVSAAFDGGATSQLTMQNFSAIACLASVATAE